MAATAILAFTGLGTGFQLGTRSAAEGRLARQQLFQEAFKLGTVKPVSRSFRAEEDRSPGRP